MKEYQHFLLDWDGCLAQTIEVWLNGYKETYQEFGFPQSTEELVNFSFGNQFGPLERGIDDLESFNRSLMDRIHQNLKVVDLYPGVKKFIATLREKGKGIVLATSSPRIVIDAALQHNNLSEGAFDAVITGDDVTKHKPDPEVIYKALKALHAQNGLDEAVMIGDTKSDLGAATNAGIDSILFYPPSHTTFYSLDVLKEFNPTHVFESFDSITRSIK